MIEKLLIGVFWIWGVKALFLPQFIFGKIGLWIESRSPVWLIKPLYTCPTCMASVHGTLVFILFNPGPFWDYPSPLWQWPIFCVCLAGLNFIISEFLYESD